VAFPKSAPSRAFICTLGIAGGTVLTSELEQFRRKIHELEQKCSKLEYDLQISEDRFYKIFHASFDMMIISSLVDGHIIDLNEETARMSGYKREELIGSLEDKHSLWACPEQRNAVIDKLKQDGRLRNEEVGFRGKAGEIHRVLFSANPITLNNEPCLLGVFIDITDRENAEEVLRKSEEYMFQIINRIGDPIFVKDRNHNLLLLNDAMCAFLGLPRDQLIGQPGMPMETEVAKHLWKMEEEVFITGKENLSEDTVTDRQGRTHIVQTKKSLLTDKKGDSQIVGVVRDITEHKRMEAQFLQSQKMEAIGVLAGGVAHDFNNLLNIINGYSELVLDDLDPANPMYKDIEQVRDAGQRAAALTSQLLAFGRKQILQPEILDLNAVIENMSSMFRRLIGEDIELIFRTQPVLGNVHADPGKIQQIILNLIVNSRDAMPSGGKLIIETANVDFKSDILSNHPMSKPGPYVMMAISDNGIGMDAETQARIFEPFFTTKTKGKGTGLGLATVYGIVKQSNGFIWVYSESGKGTTVKIYFPKIESGEAQVQSEGAAELEQGGTETILLAEDEEAVRLLTSRILRDKGYHVLEAAEGLQALRIAQDYEGKIDLILTDVVMPGISGATLVARLRAQRPGIRALYLSGYTDNAIVHHGMLDANIAFLQKPFSVDGLLRKVRVVLNPPS
jgi:two-component system, cell cycle sensor histidine kinase and response regulator CckA